MEAGKVTRHVISKGSYKGYPSEEVVYKTSLGKHKGKQIYSSRTRHEIKGRPL